MARLLSDALAIPPISPEDALAHVQALAGELGKAAATEALDGGDYHYYKSEPDLPVSSLPKEYWDAMWHDNLIAGIAALEPKTRAALPADDALFEAAYKIYLDAWAQTIDAS